MSPKVRRRKRGRTAQDEHKEMDCEPSTSASAVICNPSTSSAPHIHVASINACKPPTPTAASERPLNYIPPATFIEEKIANIQMPEEVQVWLKATAIKRRQTDCEDLYEEKRRGEEVEDKPFSATEGSDMEKEQNQEKQRLLQCKQCWKWFNTKIELIWHQNTHEILPRIFPKCSICRAEFRSMKDFVEHVNRRKQEKECAMYRCFPCQKMYTRTQKIKHQMVTYGMSAREKGKYVSCHECKDT